MTRVIIFTISHNILFLDYKEGHEHKTYKRRVSIVGIKLGPFSSKPFFSRKFYMSQDTILLLLGSVISQLKFIMSADSLERI